MTKEEIKEFLEEQIGPCDVEEDHETYIFFGDLCIVTIFKDNKDLILYHWRFLMPDQASFISLNIKDFCDENGYNFFIDEFFSYDHNKKCIVFGEEAVKADEKEEHKSFQEEVDKQKAFDYIMHSDIGIEC